jgi:hypothetical protein
LIGKIPYLQDLGVTAVELQPVFQFDEQDAPAGLTNYWGYSPLWFELPPIPADESRPWRRWLDTFLEAPDDICVFSNARLVRGSSYLVNPRSIVGLARIADPATSTTEFCLTETE